MTKRTVANNFLYYLFCGFSGAVTSLIVWLFLKLMGLGIGLVWDTIPSNFDFKFYPIIVCTAGGIILGIWQKLTNAVPDELDEVMKKVKKDKFYVQQGAFSLRFGTFAPCFRRKSRSRGRLDRCYRRTLLLGRKSYERR